MISPTVLAVFFVRFFYVVMQWLIELGYGPPLSVTTETPALPDGEVAVADYQPPDHDQN